MVDINRAKELLTYDPETGIFRWRHKHGRMKAGEQAGSLNSEGYMSIKIDMKQVLAHRLAWLWIYGEEPPREIKHLNGNLADNRIANLDVRRPDGVRKPCLGPLCRGERDFVSTGPGHRICNACHDSLNGGVDDGMGGTEMAAKTNMESCMGIYDITAKSQKKEPAIPKIRRQNYGDKLLGEGPLPRAIPR